MSKFGFYAMELERGVVDNRPAGTSPTIEVTRGMDGGLEVLDKQRRIRATISKHV